MSRAAVSSIAGWAQVLAMALISIAVLAACGSGSPPSQSATAAVPTSTAAPSAAQTVVIHVGDAEPIRAELAITPAERQRGLMGRSDLPEGTGMVFVYPGETSSSFFMFRTLVPLSIAFVNDDRVVSVEEMTPCPSDTSGDCLLYRPAGTYTFAVEAPAGWFTDAGVQPGDPVTVDPGLPMGS